MGCEIQQKIRNREMDVFLNYFIAVCCREGVDAVTYDAVENRLGHAA